MHGARLHKTSWRDAMARDLKRDLLGWDRDILLRDRDETRDASVQDWNKTETLVRLETVSRPKWKTSINFVYPDVWLPWASRLQSLTVIQQCVYQMTFKKQLVKSGLFWSITLSILLSMNWKIVFIFMVAQLANILINLTAGSWKTKQLDKVSAKVSKIWTKCVLVCYLDYVIIPLWIKMQYFVAADFLR